MMLRSISIRRSQKAFRASLRKFSFLVFSNQCVSAVIVILVCTVFSFFGKTCIVEQFRDDSTNLRGFTKFQWQHPSTNINNEENRSRWITNYCENNHHEVVDIISLQTQSILFLDVGGHKGRTTFPPILCLPIKHQVITVEPVFRNQEMLSSLAKRMGIFEPSFHWRLVRGGLSNRTGYSEIFIPGKYTDNAALASSAARWNVGRSKNYTSPPTSQIVQLFRGDDLLLPYEEYPNFIKIDVQGAEALVIQGMTKLLSKSNNMLVFAEHDPGLIDQHELGVADAFKYMNRLGFDVYCRAHIVVRDGRFVVLQNSTTVTLKQVQDRKWLWRHKCKDLIYWKGER